jgi:hypothetical protein
MRCLSYFVTPPVVVVQYSFCFSFVWIKWVIKVCRAVGTCISGARESRYHLYPTSLPYEGCTRPKHLFEKTAANNEV